MLQILPLFLASGAAIYFAAEFFVNGVEWFGRRIGISETATGTVLAAFGTALPESAVTAAAVIFGHDAAQKDIGIGAAVGGPLVLATISYAVVGLTLALSYRRLGRADARVASDARRLARDQGWFLAIFAAKVGLGLFAFAFKPWLGLLFLLAYAIYLRREIGDHRGSPAPVPEPLKLHPHGEPPMWLVCLQTGIALAITAAASRVFVDQLAAFGRQVGLQPQLAALLLSPLATEMPETMNALIWVRQGKERLALANISGAMMIQATVPAALGLIFTPWLFSSSVLIAALVTIGAVLALWLLFRRGHVDGRAMIPMAGLYGVFAAAVALA
ncbi:MAG: sodium:calcium antiporter [Nevskia sp.]|nr:sodium:calcium antiporter [Nevskia sp.]